MTNDSTTPNDSTKRQRTRTRKPVWRRLFASVAAVLAVLIVVPLVTFFAAYSVTKVPQPEELVNNQISQIFANDGTTELARIVPPEGNRQNVDIEEIPEPVRNAVLSAEDRDFYDNPGFSITGFGRAALGQLTGEDAGGGSTITQQYVKNAVVGDERSLVRKGKELVISSKMSREWSKDEILEAYLNTIYFGRNAYGISAASRAYFNKPIQELTPAEGAVLAASIQRPSQLDPWTNRPEAEQRWNYVADGLVGMGSVSRQERDEMVYPEVIDPAEVDSGSVAEGTNGLIKSQVLAELNANGITEEAVNTGGLKITTTIDANHQRAMVENVHSAMDAQADTVRSAGVAIDPNTGGVRAYYGGDDPTGLDWANAGLQTGSTFKIFTMAAAVEQGISTSTPYDSSPVTTGATEVNNVEGESCGTCSMAEALKRSLNTSFIRVARDLNGGPQDVADMAHRLGVAEELPGIGETLRENGGTPYEGITLGQYQSRPIDMASALATLTNQGRYIPAHFVWKVETSDGEMLMDNTGMESTQVVQPEVADEVIAAMGPIAAYSNGHSLANGRPSAAKTGTAQLGDTGQNKDAWMIGSTPQLATAVWIGDTDGQPLMDGRYGGSMYGSQSPSDIWQGFMNEALVNDDIEQFDSSVPVVQDPQAGSASSSGSSEMQGGAGAGGGTGGGAAEGGEDTGGAANDVPDTGADTGNGTGQDTDIGRMIDDFLNNL
ncbi:Putative penicillin-binding protein [Corynebacterium glyciniphilum AJ 3170]|uniref:Putative penicillin-binding protein n=1 Tax=Corynebacterium glyciniphilum AJ 3170 TaxID=1404245 RepID=X5EG99_9CORY|nr:Putative penicillin-binding protein [Corynebacterium glyciniphilum AJ 3170]